MNEQIKQQILNGAYAITREGDKAKLLHTSNTNDDDCKYLFIIDKGKNGEDSVWLNTEFTYHNHIETVDDIVGLWVEPLKPFDLKKAFQGEPVVLRNGLKAFMKFTLPLSKSGRIMEYPLIGYVIFDDNTIVCRQWTAEGKYDREDSNHDYDIIGMWQDPEQSLNPLPPKALKEPKESMWYLDLNSEEVFLSSYTEKDPLILDHKTFNLGMYFDSKEKAEAMLHFLKNNKE